MAVEKALKRARKDKRAGKSPSTQAGEFVRDEIERIRAGEHGARSAKQAIAIGLSRARRAGVELPPSKDATTRVRRKAKQDLAAGKSRAKPSPTRSRATTKALRKEPTSSVSKHALSKQAKAAAKKRTPASRSAAAKKAARSKGAGARSDAAKKAAATRRRNRAH